MEKMEEVRSNELDQKIIRQVEYYFGDHNLPRDKFLQENIKLDDGWIPLSTMLNFKRLAALTTDQDVIIEALKKSSKLIEVDEENKKIRRSVEKPVPEMTEGRVKEIQARTVYCKGFSKENATLDKLLEFFSQYGSVDNVQMRSYLDKAIDQYIFKGSVFVVFSKKEDADEFMKKESVEYEGVKLIIKKQEDYFCDKKKEREEKKKIQKAKVQQATNKRPQPGQKAQDDEDKESEEEEEDKGPNFPRGAVVYMKDVPKNATREDIKSAVASVWRKGAKEGEDTDVTVAYVDFNMGDSEGWIRLSEANTACTLLERAKAVQEKSQKTKSKEKDGEGKEESSAVSDDVKSDEVKSAETDKEPSNEDGAVVKASDDKMEADGEEESGSPDENKDAEGQEDSVSKIEVRGSLVSIRALQGSEENEYLEKAQGAREKKLMNAQKNRKRGGHGGNRRAGKGKRK